VSRRPRRLEGGPGRGRAPAARSTSAVGRAAATSARRRAHTASSAPPSARAASASATSAACSSAPPLAWPQRRAASARPGAHRRAPAKCVGLCRGGAAARALPGRASASRHAGWAPSTGRRGTRPACHGRRDAPQAVWLRPRLHASAAPPGTRQASTPSRHRHRHTAEHHGAALPAPPHAKGAAGTPGRRRGRRARSAASIAPKGRHTPGGTPKAPSRAATRASSPHAAALAPHVAGVASARGSTAACAARRGISARRLRLNRRAHEHGARVNSRAGPPLHGLKRCRGGAMQA